MVGFGLPCSLRVAVVVFVIIVISDENGSQLCFHAPRINPKRRVLEHVLVPLRL